MRWLAASRAVSTALLRRQPSRTLATPPSPPPPDGDAPGLASALQHAWTLAASDRLDDADAVLASSLTTASGTQRDDLLAAALDARATLAAWRGAAATAATAAAAAVDAAGAGPLASATRVRLAAVLAARGEWERVGEVGVSVGDGLPQALEAERRFYASLAAAATARGEVAVATALTSAPAALADAAAAAGPPFGRRVAGAGLLAARLATDAALTDRRLPDARALAEGEVAMHDALAKSAPEAADEDAAAHAGYRATTLAYTLGDDEAATITAARDVAAATALWGANDDRTWLRRHRAACVAAAARAPGAAAAAAAAAAAFDARLGARSGLAGEARAAAALATLDSVNAERRVCSVRVRV